MKLVITDLIPTLDARLAAQVQAMCRNVRITQAGFLRRGPRRQADQWPGPDWRHYYQRTLKRLFPNGWIYRGGHHLAVHASPPPDRRRSWQEPPGVAGQCLFRICEAQWRTL